MDENRNMKNIRYDSYIEKNKPDKKGQFFSKLFYGVVLEKMRKVLVIRTPYVFFNKTKMLMELRIIDLAQDEQARFTLQPGDKYALDSNFFFLSLQVKVIDKAMGNLASITSDRFDGVPSPKHGRVSSPQA